MIFSSCKTWGDAPDFEFYDKDEGSYMLSDFYGKPIVLNFWASWCGPCVNEMPSLQKAYEEYGNEVEFIIVNLTGWEQDSTDGKYYISYKGYTFPAYYDLKGTASQIYGFDSIPQTFFIDKEGNIASRHVGTISYSRLESEIEKIK